MQTSTHNKNEPVIQDKNIIPYPTRTLDPPITLIDRVKEIEIAGNTIQSHVNGKLDLILKQIQNLQNEAKKIIEQAEEDILLHKIKCNFEKKVGMIIHLYTRKTGESFFSLLSSEEWLNSPATYKASYRIKPDMGFEKL
ncbi:MAG: DUF2452 domain-containing protein [Spirochaetia bacterium]|nr:DUF2452 domain-containing protein [Spirochaetia bacterium]